MDATEFRLRHHAVVDEIVLFDYRLTCRTGLHIGAGKRADLVESDLPVMRDAAGRPFVPGSSLRGVLRAGAEALSKSLALDSAKPAAQAEQLPGVPRELSELWHELDLVQRIFGTVIPGTKKALASRLQISDAVCRSPIITEVRDGVGISRETRTASHDTGAKFDIEVVPAGTTFEGRIRFKNPAAFELGLLAQGLWMLDEGLLLLGGKSARGLGWVEVTTSTPSKRSAQEILRAGKSTAPDTPRSFGPVPEKLAQYLTCLQQLADTTAQGPHRPQDN